MGTKTSARSGCGVQWTDRLIVKSLEEDVPEDLRKLEVIDEGWLIDAQINQLEVFIAEQTTF